SISKQNKRGPDGPAVDGTWFLAIVSHTPLTPRRISHRSKPGPGKGSTGAFSCGPSSPFISKPNKRGCPLDTLFYLVRLMGLEPNSVYKSIILLYKKPLILNGFL
ncbi:MAG: hypothetical protein IJM20_00320, partial [Clostridia bacterium]|nr:hypothetical protein [Clostridia bacterium]